MSQMIIYTHTLLRIDGERIITRFIHENWIKIYSNIALYILLDFFNL